MAFTYEFLFLEIFINHSKGKNQRLHYGEFTVCVPVDAFHLSDPKIAVHIIFVWRVNPNSLTFVGFKYAPGLWNGRKTIRNKNKPLPASVTWIISFEWRTVERPERHASRQAEKQIDRQVDRQANRHTSNISLIATRGVPYTAPLCSQWKNDLTPSNATDFIPWCEAERGLTSVQLYLRGAHIAWHQKGREWSLSAARSTGPRFLNGILF